MSSRSAVNQLTVLALCVLAGAALPVAGCAEAPPAGTFTPYLADASTDSMLVVVELRPAAAIEYDLGVAKAKRAASTLRRETASLYQTRAATLIRIKDTEIDALKARIDQSKSENDESGTRQFEAQRDLAEVEKSLLKRREQLRREEIDYAEAEIDFHGAQAEAFASELELARMRARRADIVGAIPTRERFAAAWRFDQQVRDQEGRTLDARAEAAKRQKKLAEGAVAINKARKRVWESQKDLIEQAGAVN